MAWQVQVLTRSSFTGLSEWKSLRPVGGKPYVFATYSEAERTRKLISNGPVDHTKTRIVES